MRHPRESGEVAGPKAGHTPAGQSERADPREMGGRDVEAVVHPGDCRNDGVPHPGRAFTHARPLCVRCADTVQAVSALPSAEVTLTTIERVWPGLNATWWPFAGSESASVRNRSPPITAGIRTAAAVTVTRATVAGSSARYCVVPGAKSVGLEVVQSSSAIGSPSGAASESAASLTSARRGRTPPAPLPTPRRCRHRPCWRSR